MPLLSAFLILIIIISCSDNEILNEAPNEPIVNKTGSLNGSVSMNDVKFLASSIPEELFAQSSRTRNTENSESSTSIPEKEIEIIIPIIEENDTLLWIVNYKNDNNGYVVISADKNRFPILGFNNEGSFSADRELNYQLEDMINNAKASKLISSKDSTNTYRGGGQLEQILPDGFNRIIINLILTLSQIITEGLHLPVFVHKY